MKAKRNREKNDSDATEEEITGRKRFPGRLADRQDI